MEQLIFRPRIFTYQTCRQFAEAFELGEEDLVLTNAYIYDPFFQELSLSCRVICQEQYGMGEPTDEMAAKILKDIPTHGCRRVIAIGGGTIIDLAKVIAAADTTEIDALYERMPNLSKVRELVIIPTTCGTGSEVTNIAVLNRLQLGTKMGLVSEAMYADYAVLIPELLTSLPLKVFATSSIDALVHAVESALSPKATDYTRIFSYRAIEMIVQGYRILVDEGLEQRNRLMDSFLTASNFAGLAFGTAGCGTVHAMAYPLGGQYHVAHGESNYAMFTGIMQAYEADPEQKKGEGELEKLQSFLAGLLGCDPGNAFDCLEQLLDQILLKKALREYGVKEADLPAFAHSVIANQQRLLANSYVPMTEEKVLAIYRKLY